MEFYERACRRETKMIEWLHPLLNDTLRVPLMMYMRWLPHVWRQWGHLIGMPIWNMV